MGKYDAQLGDLKNRLAQAQEINIVLPAQLNVDRLASGLALFLSLEQAQKQLSIVSEGDVLVAHSNLYGVGKVSNKLPQSGSGNFTLTLEGVVAEDGTVPALEKLDWFPEGNNLNLVFHVLPGQIFSPAKVTPQYQASSASGLMFVIGASNLTDLGSIYASNQTSFSNLTIVNIDNNPANANFGQLNLVDPNASLSEIINQVLDNLGLSKAGDISSNILTGIYSVTANMSSNLTPDTFMAVGQAMQAGGKIPVSGAQPVQTEPAAQAVATFDYKQFIQPAPATPQPVLPQEQFIVPPVVGSNEQTPQEQPAPDWLTPKVYKGGSLG
ncbi:hypothetical protein HY025_02920 [Candidatus Daviesbacteria bacterium]|nr:hypothetical protein [Candidatus Daviesbacteria bacterium]